MKQCYLLLFLFLSFHSFAQWEIVPVNTADTLNDIQYVDGSYFVGGQNSAFLKSLDEGDSFELMIHPNGKIGKISFFDEMSGITTWSATYGQSFMTIDGGNSWAPTPEWYVTVDAVGDSILYMYKYNIISLSDEQTILSETNIDILVDTNQVTQYETGNIGGWSWVLKSENRGESILSGSFPYATDYIYQSFAVNSDTICFLQYLDNKLFKSLDEGLNWEVLDVPEFQYSSGDLSHRVFYFDSNLNGFISDYQGNLYKTLDAGDTWQQVPGVESSGLNDITFVNDLEGYLVGDSGLVMTTVDGGSTWHQENSGTIHSLNAIDFDDENIIAVGDSGIIIKRPRYLLIELNVSSLSGGSLIVSEGGTLQLQASPLPADATNSSVSWSVENLSGEAIISEDGLLTAVNNGVVLARATSQANPAVFDEMAIAISNQPDTSPLVADTTVCLGDTLTLNASRPNATYLWQGTNVLGYR